MMDIKINIDKVYNFISKEEILKLKNNTLTNIKALCNATGKGNDFLGWVNLPSEINDDLLNDIQNVANSFKAKTDIVVVVGIGGSYLGAKAVNDALANNFDLMLDSGNPKVIYAGQNISEDYLYELQQVLRNKSFGIVVISKSGTTTEPAIAFRVLKELAEQKYGKQDARERIVAITDENKGALRELSDQEGYKTFVIPDNVGGRYSVLTPVGLLPIAIAGYDIIELVKGAKRMQKVCTVDEFENNPAALYAATRNVLYNNGKTLEILANYNPKLHYFAEWWKQLYGESEGKEGKGIFPASVDLTSDLHSMGQYIQEGQRNIFETVLSVKNTNYNLTIPNDQNNLDKLNYLAGKHVDFVNKMAELGTQIAHVDGGVPNIRIEIEKLDEYNIGQLIYFFEIACGISGYLLNVNPFDQPGVEAYKSNMFALLEKPGFEKQSEEIKKRLG